MCIDGETEPQSTVARSRANTWQSRASTPSPPRGACGPGCTSTSSSLEAPWSHGEALKEFTSAVNSSAIPSTDSGRYVSLDPETSGGVLGATRSSDGTPAVPPGLWGGQILPLVCHSSLSLEPPCQKLVSPEEGPCGDARVDRDRVQRSQRCRRTSLQGGRAPMTKVDGAPGAAQLGPQRQAPRDGTVLALRWGLGAPPDLDVRGAPKRPALNHGWECDEALPRRDVRKGKDLPRWPRPRRRPVCTERRRGRARTETLETGTGSPAQAAPGHGAWRSKAGPGVSLDHKRLTFCCEARAATRPLLRSAWPWALRWHLQGSHLPGSPPHCHVIGGTVVHQASRAPGDSDSET